MCEYSGFSSQTGAELEQCEPVLVYSAPALGALPSAPPFIGCPYFPRKIHSVCERPPGRSHSFRLRPCTHPCTPAPIGPRYTNSFGIPSHDPGGGARGRVLSQLSARPRRILGGTLLRFDVTPDRGSRRPLRAMAGRCRCSTSAGGGCLRKANRRAAPKAASKRSKERGTPSPPTHGQAGARNSGKNSGDRAHRIPQPHGGSLLPGGMPGNKGRPGRPRN